MDLLAHHPFGIEGALLHQISAISQKARRIIGKDVLAKRARVGAPDDRACRDRQRTVHEPVGRAQEAFVGIEVLRAICIEPASADILDDAAVDFPAGFRPQLVQFILDPRLLDEADLTPTPRIGEQHIGRIGVIELASNRIGAASRHGKSQAILRTRARSARTGIGLIVDVVAGQSRITIVDHKAEVVGHLEIKIGADGEDLGLAAFGIGTQDRHYARESGRIGEGASTRCAFELRTAPRSNRSFCSAEHARVFGVGVKSIDVERELIAWLELQRTGNRKALKIAAYCALPRVIGRIDQILGRAANLELVGFKLAADKLGGIGLQRRPKRPAHRAILVLIDV